MFVRAKGIKRICGNYCSWHEISLNTEYIFGDLFYIHDEAYEYLMDKLNLVWEDEDEDALEKQDKTILDKLIKKYIEDFEYDFCDIIVDDCLVETDNDGKVLEVYW